MAGELHWWERIGPTLAGADPNSQTASVLESHPAVITKLMSCQSSLTASRALG